MAAGLSPSGFTFRILDAGPNPEVAFAGELDMAGAERAWRDLEILLNPVPRSLVIDLSEVSFIDSRGLSVLLRAWVLLGSDGTITLRDPIPRVREMLRVAGVDGAFHIT